MHFNLKFKFAKNNHIQLILPLSGKNALLFIMINKAVLFPSWPLPLKVPNVRLDSNVSVRQCLLSTSKLNLLLGTHFHALISTHHIDFDVRCTYVKNLTSNINLMFRTFSGVSMTWCFISKFFRKWTFSMLMIRQAYNNKAYLCLVQLWIVKYKKELLAGNNKWMQTHKKVQ